MMIEIENVLISTELKTELFACDLAKCKGACCVEGDLGAPLEEEEKMILEEIYPEVKPYLPESGKEAIEQQGRWVKDFTQEISTPLVRGNHCAYTVFEKGMALCGIEKAWLDGKISFQKPISCHLYPIRIEKLRSGDALNYDRWDICSPACAKGKAEGIPVYKFVKGPLIRKYGEKFYAEMEAVMDQLDTEDLRR